MWGYGAYGVSLVGFQMGCIACNLGRAFEYYSVNISYHCVYSSELLSCEQIRIPRKFLIAFLSTGVSVPESGPAVPDGGSVVWV